VSDLGSQDMFIGHEWLKLHNPSIDWKKAEIRFDGCPPNADIPPILRDLESDIDDTEDYVKPLEKAPTLRVRYEAYI